VEQHSGWSEYLDDLEIYLQQVSRSLEQQNASGVPVLSTQQPGGPVPVEEVERASAILAETRRVAVQVGIWVEEVLASMRSIDVRRRLEPCRVIARVDSVL
jgi:hypothetical protein